MQGTGIILWTPQRALKDAGAFPVKVRAADGALVGSGVSGQPIEVPIGSYRVSVLLPDGHETVARHMTRVSAGQMVNPRIILPDEEARARIVARTGNATFQMTSHLEDLIETKADIPASRTVTASQWRGEWLADWANPQEALRSGLMEEALTLTETEQLMLFADDAHDRFLITTHQREQDGQTILRFSIVPHDECVACVGEEGEARLILAAIREDSHPPAIKYASAISPEANALLNFVDAGVLGEMQTVSAAFIGQGKEAILQSRVSLLRGLMGAYVMLRSNTLDGLPEFLGEMAEMAPLVPDTYTLKAELFARAGRHDAAVQEIRRAMDALCPWFRAGVSYLLERLRLYTDLDEETKATLGLSPEDWAAFSHARKRLERMAPMLVVSQIFTTFDIPK